MQPSTILARGTLLAAATLLSPLAAQESYWVANRGSSDVMQISPSGELLQTIPLGTSLRSAHVAPDGKVWIVRFIQPQFDILNDDGSTFGTISYALGNPYDIKFDRAGNAWISGGTGVEQFDPNGVSLATFPLTASAPLGIAIDSNDNKWIAHRSGPPGSVSRIDGTTGAVTNHPMPPTSQILPTRVAADFRGPGMGSRIWVIGDNRGAGELIELDDQGNALNTYVLDPGGNFGSIVTDVDPATLAVGAIRVGDFRNGNIHEVDPATGAIVVTTAPDQDCIGLAVDGFNNIWTTSRSTTSITRLDPLLGTVEMITGVGSGVQSALSTRYDYVTVVDPFGDLDGDTIANVAEVIGESSPFDPCSIPTASLSIEGPTAVGATTSIRALAPANDSVALLVAGGTAAPRRFRGIACTFDLDPASLVPGLLALPPGNQTLTFNLPSDPTLAGVTFYAQGVISPNTLRFTNVIATTLY